MELLPRSMGTRPRVAVEVRPEGVVAARGDETTGLLTAVSRGDLRPGAVVPGLKAGNFADPASVVGAVRRVLDGISSKGKERSRYVTVVIPDASARVLLLDFDALPGKPAEALAVIRFRLKKLLPFDADHAVVSYQSMGSSDGTLRVLAVAMPADVLAEYERVVTEAGYLPGSVLPSTLAVLAGLEDAAGVALVVNAGGGSVTTAIVRGGELLLHRTLDLSGTDAVEAAEPAAADVVERRTVPDMAEAGGPMAAGMRRSAAEGGGVGAGEQRERSGDADYDRMDAMTEMQESVLEAQTRTGAAAAAREANDAWSGENEVGLGREVTQSVSVAAAYHEDTLGAPPEVVLSAGTLGAERLAAALRENGMDGVRVHEMVDAQMFAAGAPTGAVGRGWLAGVRGALRV